MKILRCDHIHLITANVEETVRWYCRVFEATITFQGKFRGSDVYYLAMGGMIFIIFGQLDHEASPHPGSLQPKMGVDHFGFAVENLNQAVTELQAAGATILEGPIDVRPGLRIAYVEGPDHIRIELSERQ